VRREGDTAGLERYPQSVGSPVENAPLLIRYEGWGALAADKLVIWANADVGYLFTVAQPCTGLQGAERIQLTSRISYTAGWRGRVVIAIKNGNVPPLTLPNVLRNVIAHELGHSVGLEHNEDAMLLMCGRPTPCRPDAFRSETPRFFPLSTAERARLLAMYSREWPAR
jgi:hypothetical protein